MYWMKHVAIYLHKNIQNPSFQIKYLLFLVAHITHISFTFTQVQNAQHCAILYGIKYTLLTVCLQIGATNT